MSKSRAFLTAILVLATASIAEADLILTLNGVDTSDSPLIISNVQELLIAVEGSTAIGPNDVSLTAVGGVLEPLGDPNNRYSFEFDANSSDATISLIAEVDMVIDGNFVSPGTAVYELCLFYNREQNILGAAGMGLDDLIWFEPQGQSVSGPEDRFGALEASVAKDDSAQSLSKELAAVLQTTEPAKSYFASMSGGGTTQIDSFPEPNSYPDFNGDKIVNFIDFAIFAKNWKKSGSGLDGDFDDSGTVDANDLAILAYFWLNGPHPLDVFESFKAALAVGDVNEALTFVAEMSREKYAEIFGIIEAHLSDYAAGMGEMTFERQRFGEVIYEMLHQDGPDTLSFPVLFIRDEDGAWRIFNL